MNTGEKIAIVCEKFPQVSQTFVKLHAEMLDAEVFTLELAPGLDDQRWLGRIHALAFAPGHSRVRRFAEKVYRRIFRTPWRVWLACDQHQLCKQLQAGDFTAVVVEFGQCLIGCAEGVFGSGAKVVPYFHGVDLSAHLLDERYVRKLGPLINRCSDVIVVNELMIGRLQKVFNFKGRIHHVPCAVDTTLFVGERRMSHDGISFLFVGRLVEKKGVVELVRAFACYAALGGLGRLVIAGEGPQRLAVEAAIRAANLGERIELKGAVSHQQAAALMAMADIYVQHSKIAADGDEEGWPVAIVEACAMGLPVVATRHAGIPQQVITGHTGYLVEEGDTQGMARAMLQLANSPVLREEMGHAAQVHIRQFCDPVQCRSRLLAILQNAQPATASMS
jgi:glycosyltransferase involved in cell wall biosynthesis